MYGILPICIYLMCIGKSFKAHDVSVFFIYSSVVPPEFKKNIKSGRSLSKNQFAKVQFLETSRHSWLMVQKSGKKPPGMFKTLVNNGINYQPQLVQNFVDQQYVATEARPKMPPKKKGSSNETICRCENVSFREGN